MSCQSLTNKKLKPKRYICTNQPLTQILQSAWRKRLGIKWLENIGLPVEMHMASFQKHGSVNIRSFWLLSKPIKIVPATELLRVAHCQAYALRKNTWGVRLNYTQYHHKKKHQKREFRELFMHGVFYDNKIIIYYIFSGIQNQKNIFPVPLFFLQIK